MNGSLEIIFADTKYADMQLLAQCNHKYRKLLQVYDEYNNVNVILHDYKTVLPSLNSSPILYKALELELVSTIEYFMETG